MARTGARRPRPPSPRRWATTRFRRGRRSSELLGAPTAAAIVLRHAADEGARVGDAHALHAERGAAPPRARRRGVGWLLRAALRRGRGALAGDGTPPRLRLRDSPHARQAPTERRADPPRGGVSRRARRRGPLSRRAPADAARHAAQEGALRV